MARAKQWHAMRRGFRRLLISAVVILGVGFAMRAVGFEVRVGQPPVAGWTLYPMLAVARWVESDGSIKPSRFPPRQWRRIGVGTLATCADGTRTLYIHR